MGSVSPPAEPIPNVIDEIDRLLLSAQKAGIPLIDVQSEADRLVAAWPDPRFSRDEVARAILQRCMNHGVFGVAMAPPPLDGTQRP